MEFAAHVKSVKSDLAKKEITISLVLEMDESTMDAAMEAATYTDKDAGKVMVQILPYQMRMNLETLKKE